MSGPVVPFLEVTEVDGSPSGRPITKLIVSNGDLSISGTTATIDTTGGGSSSLTATYVGFGSASNTLTGAANFVWSEANQQLKITSDETADDSVMLHLDTNTFDGTMLLVESGKAHGTGTDDDGPNIEIYRSTTGANGKYIGSFLVTGDNASDNKKEWFKILNYISDSTNGSEDSLVFFKGLNNGVDDEFIRLRGGAGVIVNENGRSNIDFRVESDSLSHAIAVDSSTNRVGLLHSAMTDIEAAVDIKLPDDESVVIRNADDDSNAGPILDLYRNTTDEADDDKIGQVKFTASDSGNAKQMYVNIKGKIISRSAGSEIGALVVTPTGNDYASSDSQMGLQVVDAGISSYAPILGFRADDGNTMNITNNDAQSKLIVITGSTNRTLKLLAGQVGQKFSFVSTGGNVTIDPDNSTTSNTLNGGTGTATRSTDNQIYEVVCIATQTWVLSNP